VKAEVILVGEVKDRLIATLDLDTRSVLKEDVENKTTHQFVLREVITTDNQLHACCFTDLLNITKTRAVFDTKLTGSIVHASTESSMTTMANNDRFLAQLQIVSSRHRRKEGIHINMYIHRFLRGISNNIIKLGIGR